jgi:hypothetical protein
VYDNAGRAVANVNALNQRNTTVYNANGDVAANINGLGNALAATPVE